MLFPLPRLADERDGLPGRELEIEAASTSPSRDGYENDTPSSRTALLAGLGGASDAGRTAGGRVSARIRSSTAIPSAPAW